MRYAIRNVAGKLKRGQVLIVDCGDEVVFHDVLADDGLGDGDHLYDWTGTLDDGTDLLPERMPYRVQVQVHSDEDEAEGLALAVMHTEVRLFAHPDSGTNPMGGWIQLAREHMCGKCILKSRGWAVEHLVNPGGGEHD